MATNRGQALNHFPKARLYLASHSHPLKDKAEMANLENQEPFAESLITAGPSFLHLTRLREDITGQLASEPGDHTQVEKDLWYDTGVENRNGPDWIPATEFVEQEAESDSQAPLSDTDSDSASVPLVRQPSDTTYLPLSRTYTFPSRRPPIPNFRFPAPRWSFDRRRLRALPFCLRPHPRIRHLKAQAEPPPSSPCLGTPPRPCAQATGKLGIDTAWSHSFLTSSTSLADLLAAVQASGMTLPRAFANVRLGNTRRWHEV